MIPRASSGLLLIYRNCIVHGVIFLSPTLFAASSAKSSVELPTLTLTKVIYGGTSGTRKKLTADQSKGKASREWTSYRINVGADSLEFQVIEDIENHRVALVLPSQTLMQTTLYEPSNEELAKYRLLQTDAKKVGAMNPHLAERIHSELKSIERNVLFEKWYLGGNLHLRCSGEKVGINGIETANPGLILEKIHGVFPRFISLETMIGWGWIEPLKSKDLLSCLLDGQLLEGSVGGKSNERVRVLTEGPFQHPGHFKTPEFQYTTSYGSDQSYTEKRQLTPYDLKRAWPVRIRRNSGEEESILWFDFQRKLGRCMIVVKQNKIQSIHILDPYGFLLSSNQDLKFKIFFSISQNQNNIMSAFIAYNFPTAYDLGRFVPLREISPVPVHTTSAVRQANSWDSYMDLSKARNGASWLLPGTEVRRFDRSFQLLPLP